MTDDELSAVFCQSAEGVMSPARIDALLEAAWSLETAPDVSTLMTLATLD